MLTWLLRTTLVQPSSKIALMASVSPASTSYEDTLRSLKYTERLCSGLVKKRRTADGPEGKGYVNESNTRTSTSTSTSTSLHMSMSAVNSSVNGISNISHINSMNNSSVVNTNTSRGRSVLMQVRKISTFNAQSVEI